MIFFGAARFTPATKLAYVFGKILLPKAEGQVILPADAPKNHFLPNLFSIS